MLSRPENYFLDTLNVWNSSSLPHKNTRPINFFIEFVWMTSDSWSPNKPCFPDNINCCSSTYHLLMWVPLLWCKSPCIYYKVGKWFFFWYLLLSYILGEYLFITWTTIMFNAGSFENVAELFDIEWHSATFAVHWKTFLKR